MRMRGSPLAWKPGELAILMDVYPKGGASKVIAAGVKRSTKSVKRKAAELGLRLSAEVRRKISLDAAAQAVSRPGSPIVSARLEPFALPDEYIQAADIFQVGYRYFKQYGWEGSHVAASV